MDVGKNRCISNFFPFKYANFLFEKTFTFVPLKLAFVMKFVKNWAFQKIK